MFKGEINKDVGSIQEINIVMDPETTPQQVIPTSRPEGTRGESDIVETR